MGSLWLAFTTPALHRVPGKPMVEGESIKWKCNKPILSYSNAVIHNMLKNEKRETDVKLGRMWE